jgi:hypothetical protein
MAQIILPVEAMEGMTSEERAKEVSHELWRIRRPASVASPDEITQYVFGWIEHPVTGQFAISATDDYMLRVHPDHAPALDILWVLFPQVPESEKEQLRQYIDANSEVLFVNIIPSTSTVLTYEEAEAAGWFSVDPE